MIVNKLTLGILTLVLIFIFFISKPGVYIFINNWLKLFDKIIIYWVPSRLYSQDIPLKLCKTYNNYLCFLVLIGRLLNNLFTMYEGVFCVRVSLCSGYSTVKFPGLLYFNCNFYVVVVHLKWSCSYFWLPCNIYKYKEMTLLKYL